MSGYTKSSLIAFITILAIVPLSSLFAQTRFKQIPFVDLCSMVEDADRYQDKYVKLKTLWAYSTVSRIHGDAGFLYSSKCNSGDSFIALQWSDKAGAMYDEANHRLEIKFLRRLPPERNNILEITIEGKFQHSFVPMFGDLSWAINNLDDSKVISIRDVTNSRAYPRPNSKAPTPGTDQGIFLKELTRDQLFYFMGRPTGRSEYYFDENLVITDPNGKIYRLEEAGDVRIEALVEKSIETDGGHFVSGPLVRLINGKIIASGTFGLTNKAKNAATLHYECVYRKSDNSFVLESIKLTR